MWRPNWQGARKSREFPRRRDARSAVPEGADRERTDMTDVGLKRAEAPEQVGFSSARLERLASVVRQDVERRLIPGAVMLLARGGRVAFADSFGFQDREAGAPMGLDSIFRIASMTKPMSSVAAMMLSEE